MKKVESLLKYIAFSREFHFARRPSPIYFIRLTSGRPTGNRLFNGEAASLGWALDMALCPSPVAPNLDSEIQFG